MKKQNQRLCCSKLEEPPRFGSSDKTHRCRKKFKKKKFFKANQKYYKKINIRRNSTRKINLKEDLRPMHLKSANVGYAMKKGIMQMNALKRRKQT